MAEVDIKINGVEYLRVPCVQIPLKTPDAQSGRLNASFYDVSDATLTSRNNLPSDVIAYGKNGAKVVGTASINNSTDLTVNGAIVTAPAGFYSSSASKSVATGTVTSPDSITGSGASLTAESGTLTLTKTISVTPSVTTEGYVTSGTAGDSTVELSATVNLPSYNNDTITPGISDIVIPANSYTADAITVKGDAELIASNIVYNHTIFGVAGTCTLVNVSYDSNTRVVSIS